MFLYNKKKVTASRPLQEIMYFKSSKRQMELVCRNGSRDTFYCLVSDLEDRLEGQGFIRISRSVIVNRLYVKYMGYSKVELEDGTVLAVGRAFSRTAKASFIGEQNLGHAM